MVPYRNEHAARINDPDKYDEFRRENDAFGDGIHAIYGITGEGKSRKSEVQAIRFSKKKFTPKEARKWLAEHKYKVISFEKATGSDEKLSDDIPTGEWIRKRNKQRGD